MTCRHPHRGFTLIELVIVLAILAAVTGLAWPSLRRMSAKGQVQEAGRQLRLALSQARLAAIEAGEVRLFRYQPGTGRYEVVALPEPATSDGTPPDPASVDTPPAADESRGSLALDGEEPGEPVAEVVDQLPAGIIFLPDDGDEPAGSDAALPPAPTADSRTGDDPAAYAPPVAFYPNGRTTDGCFHLGDGRRYRQEVALRGLTGTVRLGPVERMVETDGQAPPPEEVF